MILLPTPGRLLPPPMLQLDVRSFFQCGRARACWFGVDRALPLWGTREGFMTPLAILGYRCLEKMRPKEGICIRIPIRLKALGQVLEWWFGVAGTVVGT